MTLKIELDADAFNALRAAAGNRERAVIEILAVNCDGGIPANFGLPERVVEAAPEPEPAPEPRSTENAAAPAEEPETDEGAPEDDSAG